MAYSLLFPRIYPITYIYCRTVSQFNFRFSYCVQYLPVQFSQRFEMGPTYRLRKVWLLSVCLVNSLKMSHDSRLLRHFNCRLLIWSYRDNLYNWYLWPLNFSGPPVSQQILFQISILSDSSGDHAARHLTIDQDVAALYKYSLVHLGSDDAGKLQYESSRLKNEVSRESRR